jgi:hypothetical protein
MFLNRLASTILMFLLTIYAAAPGTAQASSSEPTLQDTLDWIAQALLSHSNDSRGWRLDLSYQSSSPCTIKILNSRLYTDGPSPVTLTTINLSSLDPGRLDQPPKAAVILETTNGKSGISQHYYSNRAAGQDAELYSYLMVFDTGDMKTRATKAFFHAIQLCGGKGSVF